MYATHGGSMLHGKQTAKYNILLLQNGENQTAAGGLFSFGSTDVQLALEFMG